MRYLKLFEEKKSEGIERLATLFKDILQGLLIDYNTEIRLEKQKVYYWYGEVRIKNNDAVNRCAVFFIYKSEPNILTLVLSIEQLDAVMKKLQDYENLDTPEEIYIFKDFLYDITPIQNQKELNKRQVQIEIPFDDIDKFTSNLSSNYEDILSVVRRGKRIKQFDL